MHEAALPAEADALPGVQPRLLCCCSAGGLRLHHLLPAAAPLAAWRGSIECRAAAVAHLFAFITLWHLPAFQALLFHHLRHYLSLLLGLILCDTKYKITSIVAYKVSTKEAVHAVVFSGAINSHVISSVCSPVAEHQAAASRRSGMVSDSACRGTAKFC